MLDDAALGEVEQVFERKRRRADDPLARERTVTHKQQDGGRTSADSRYKTARERERDRERMCVHRQPSHLTTHGDARRKQSRSGGRNLARVAPTVEQRHCDERPRARLRRLERRARRRHLVACPLSTRGGTRLVRLVRGRGGRGARAAATCEKPSARACVPLGRAGACGAGGNQIL